ncbi:MAG: DNA polymerase III subunit alpha [Candidatus Nomurabacteria bacterium]|jgi:DNA polymerase-3 subunit alpha|nr:DNA polymerase III subunit alpha [Candidatus Nomurabacteria bacterium]
MGDLTNADFVHLHNHTEYSVLDGMTKISELAELVKELGMEAVAVTDHGTMSGVVDLYKCATEKGVKPIFGLEAYVAARGREDKDPSKDKQRFHITLLAMNDVGLQNLMFLSSEANLHGFYYKPRIDHEIMESHAEGVICLSGCASSEISECLKVNDFEGAKKLIEWYRGVYGDRFYLELQDHGHPDAPGFWPTQKTINDGLKNLAKECDLPMVVTCDGHYLKHEDQDAHEILLCVGTASLLSDPKRMSLKDFNLHVIDPSDIIKRWGAEFPEAVKNTRAIADRCDVKLELGRILIPKFPYPKKYASEKEYMTQLVYEGIAARYLAPDVVEKIKKASPDYCEVVTEGADENWAHSMSVEAIIAHLDEKVKSRAEYELGVIDKMGYNGYFLIVWDFINWGKYHGIIFGPGRGSGAGSIIAYALRIVEIDPLAYDLLFERFLNPDRISMPDIDTDIQDDRRNELIEYCTRKYGPERVSNIVTFGRMMGKMAVRDVARVLDVPYVESDRIAKLIPDPVQGHHTPLPKLIAQAGELQNEYNSNPASKEVYDFASRLEGTIRSHGVHACGVVIAPDDLVKFVPLEWAQKGVVATQFPMGQIEELGLLKMDFLGLSNLTIINNAQRIIKKVYKTDIDLSTLGLDDPAAYELLTRGESTGVFQLESAGMKRYLKDLKPSQFEDIIAMVALYRPGPMQFIDSFIKRKHGKEDITYLHPGLENSLKNTYGILVYQEQFMQISKEWCGFTGGEADTLRKAVGKKKIDLMLKMKPKFIEGAMTVSGATKEMAETFWTQLEEFANYCFNKSHAACYALIAYWTAYIKAHFPDAFMAALMTSDAGNLDRLAIEIGECRRMGIKVLNPSINQSYGAFAIIPDQKTIRFGLNAIKGVGEGLVESVIQNRDTYGKFESVSDFAKRINATKFNKKAWEASIKTGVFDEFAERGDLLYSLEAIQGFAQKVQKEAASGQNDLFSMFDEPVAGVSLTDVEIKKSPIATSNREKLGWERELLGLYITAHPLDEYEEYMDDTMSITPGTKDRHNEHVKVGGVIDGARVIQTKNGRNMAFVKLQQYSSEVEVIVFPDMFEQVGGKMVPGVICTITGKCDYAGRTGVIGDEPKILMDSITIISDEDLQNFKATGVRKGETFAKIARDKPTFGGKTIERSAPKPKFDVSETKKFVIMIRDEAEKARCKELSTILGECFGFNPVYLQIVSPDGDKFLKLKQKVDAQDAMMLIKLAELGLGWYLE